MGRPCKVCGASPETARFYACITTHCAECWKARVRANRRAKPEQYRAFEAMRYARDYEDRRARMAAYAATEAGKAAGNAAKAAWSMRNAVKRAASLMVGRAVRAGKMQRPTTCQECGASGRIHGHHDDYAKPLDVRWLCTPCHAKAHHGERAISAIRAKEQETRA